MQLLCSKMGCKFSKFRRRTRSEATRNNRKFEGRGIVNARNEERKQEPITKLKERQHSAKSVAVDKEAISKLIQVGIDEKIANELLLLRDKGSLKTNGDIVTVLEKNNADYKVQLEDNILVRVDSLGDLSFEKVGEKIVIDPAGKIDFNTASRKSLEAIKGIGPILAGRIVAHREEHGPFAKVEDITSVRGVSKKLLDKIISQVTVRSSKIPKIPIVTPHVTTNKTVRIASWNLLSFGSDKADNDGVREVVCHTILENG